MNNIFKKYDFILFSFKKIIIFFIFCASCYLMLALITFYPFDDSYLQFTGNSYVYNLLGRKGALLSDILFFVFGFLAYIVPCIIFFLCWSCLFKNSFLNLFELSYKIIGSLILLFGLCGLVEYFLDDFYYCFSGGIVGFLLRTKIFDTFSDVTVNLILLLMVILGLILLTKYSWSMIFQKIKNYISNHDFNMFLKRNNISFLKITRMWIRINRFQILNKRFYDQYYQKIKEIYRKYISINILQKIFYILRRINYTYRYIKNTVLLLMQKYFISDISHCNLRARNIDAIKNLSLNENLFLCKFPFNILNSCDTFFGNTDGQNKKLNDIKYLNYRDINFLHDIISKNKRPKKKSIFPVMQSTLQASHGISLIKKKKLSEKVLNVFPSIDLLSSPPSKEIIDIEFLKQKSDLLELKLADYHIQARVVNIVQGPVITRFELDLAPGLKSSRISSLSRDLARALSISHLKVIEIIPGTSYIGLEIPNQKREVVYLREILDTKKFKESSSVLTLGVGKSVSDEVVIANLDTMPHLLIAGTTGSGKSVGINSMIISILYKATPEDVRFVMIDPKILELSIYDGIPHLLTNVITDMKDVISVLNWCVEEMDRRYKLMASCGARNLKNYNDRIKSFSNVNNCSVSNSLSFNNQKKFTSSLMFKKLPYIVIIVDEFSDLIISDGKQVELLIIRLSQKARACGIHLVLATQRPSVNVITGLIKANIPGRIAFAVSSKIDSRTILDQSGAESLLGMGDMLYLPPYSFAPIRVHGAFVCDKEVSSIVEHWKNICV